ncbi:LLM class flavin-dependent oxidoreductase [Streptomyces sp. SL13]|uniref:LLM class flavin-dependent oxidoreductase n=1 Tax=Streptantibioticus silvisoli TaxID=2705255 RepID=A0AA90H2W0_9ACTN|nr:LLM class flavin-dependent oxidoreductase [Streptantibioticus silvisoli]
MVQPVDMHSVHPGKEQPYPPQMKRCLDPVLLWTVAATATSRVRLNASTLSTFYWEPPHLARTLTTLDVLSGGRLDVGVGLGWMKDEHDISRGANWHRRGRMLDDLLAFHLRPQADVRPWTETGRLIAGPGKRQRNVRGTGRHVPLSRTAAEVSGLVARVLLGPSPKGSWPVRTPA